MCIANPLAVPALLLAMLFAAKNVVAQNPAECLYNDAHFHIQDFKADGPHIADILEMMDNHVCRSTLMSLAVTVAHAR